MHWGVEKHLKNDCDRLFGWFRTGVKKLVQDGAAIIEVPELQRALQQHFTPAKTKDMTAPLVIPDFKISRTLYFCEALCLFLPRRGHLQSYVFKQAMQCEAIPIRGERISRASCLAQRLLWSSGRGVEHGAKASGKGGGN